MGEFAPVRSHTRPCPWIPGSFSFGAVCAIWQRRCGQVVEDWDWRGVGRTRDPWHELLHCPRTTPAGFQDSDEPPPRFNTGLHSRQPASSRALSLASHLSLRQHFSTLTGYLHKLFCISVFSSNQNPQMPFSSFHTPSTARRLNPTQPNPSFSLSAAILVICLKLRVLG